MDCQETDITQADVQYGIFCPEPSLCKHCKVSASLASKDVFHWVFEFTLIVTPVGARKAIIVNVLTTSTFSTNEENLLSSTSHLLGLLVSLSFFVCCFVL